MGAFRANTHIIWHGEDQRTEEHFSKGMEPILDRVELKPGDLVPMIVPTEIQQEWARTPATINSIGEVVFRVTFDENASAPKKQDGPPRFELPVNPNQRPPGQRSTPPVVARESK
jgi:hypothetical protein